MLRRLIRFQFCSLQDQIRKQQNSYSNITDKMISYVGRDLHKIPSHPLGIIKNRIETFFQNEAITEKQSKYPLKYKIIDNLSPIVSVKQNFDSLLVPPDHPSRKKSDTYYINENTLLRCHTSAHQVELIENNVDAFVVVGDVYRRDEIDATHYPVFHQVEIVRIFQQDQFSSKYLQHQIQESMDDLKETLERLTRHLFGDVQMRWVETTFPFTNPSMELEIYFQDKWLEVLGCGVIHQDLMKNCQRLTEVGWAAGLGLERLALLLFQIPDIRLFWSQDPRFLDQFRAGQINKFQPFSKYPSCYKDVSFYVDHKTWEENDLHSIIRDIGGDLIEKVECVDTFYNKKKDLTSKCYRIHYRSLERTLQNEEIDVLQFKIRDQIKDILKLELR
ncbi:unnamed protein product [Paramecium primaurelia]|uniref:phenylalanine--tRNA ligase n=1 Tax=Paramecium primaurelia TaxID=5886 RepID=A0A8S1NZ23_PARPR|nr:unnamed protein product [Paramecium primaurelia]